MNLSNEQNGKIENKVTKEWRGLSQILTINPVSYKAEPFVNASHQ